MIKKTLMVLMACTLMAGALITGCDRQSTESQPVVKGEQNGVLNHGHSITETSDERPYEIRRSGDVIMDQFEAQEYLEDTVTLPDKDMRFMLDETSNDDPGAYLWYRFHIYKNDICIITEDFNVIAFTDGTICEGRTDVLTCNNFADPDNMIGPDAALEIYKQKSGDDRAFAYCFNHNYHYQVKNNECILTYMYRYDAGHVEENYTLLLDAITGERVGGWPDAIS
ncbi:hypothetical protein SAMN02910456_00097 [Ruminococcaceae bacterium YRB3002]|nr:hypothetical protein SAMN02910456_00097 [Ruminococcaceae bacterium YRB3002]